MMVVRHRVRGGGGEQRQSQEVLSTVLCVLKRQFGMTLGFGSEKLEFHLELQ